MKLKDHSEKEPFRSKFFRLAAALKKKGGKKLQTVRQASKDKKIEKLEKLLLSRQIIDSLSREITSRIIHTILGEYNREDILKISPRRSNDELLIEIGKKIQISIQAYKKIEDVRHMLISIYSPYYPKNILDETIEEYIQNTFIHNSDDSIKDMQLVKGNIFTRGIIESMQKLLAKKAPRKMQAV